MFKRTRTQFSSALMLTIISTIIISMLIQPILTETAQASPMPGKLSLELSEYSMEEDGTSLFIRVDRTGGTEGEIEVDYTTSDGTATAGEDYEKAQGTLVFESDELFQYIPVISRGDSYLEGDEWFSITLGNPANGAVADVISSAVIVIHDDENADDGIVQFSSPAYTVDEGEHEAAFTVVRTGDISGYASVSYRAYSGTATRYMDYDMPQPAYVHFEPGAAASEVGIMINEDQIFEGDETLIIELEGAEGAVIGGEHRAAVTIRDNDAPPSPGQFNFSGGSARLQEDYGFAIINVTRDGALEPASVDYYTVDGTAVGGEDFTPLSGTLTFGEGQSQRSFPVHVKRDSKVEGSIPETFTVRLRNPTGGMTVGEGDSIEVSIADNDFGQPGRFQLKLAQNVSEGDEYALVTVLRNFGSDGAVSVDYATVDGIAAAAADYEPISGTLLFAEHETSKTIAIPIIDDSGEEDSEDFAIELSNPTGGAVLGSPRNAVIWIRDDDLNTSPGVIEWGSETCEIEESSVVNLLEIVRSGGTYGEAAVDVHMYSGTAVEGVDFKSLSTTVEFGPGWDKKRLYLDLAINDFIHEEDEVFTIVLSNPQGGAVIGAADTMTVTIVDDDPDAPGELAISDSDYASESDGSVEVTVHRRNGAMGVVSVDYATGDLGSAASGADYGAVSGTLVFEAGETAKTIVIPVYDDDFIEGKESFQVALSNPAGGAVIVTPSAVAAIRDNDFKPSELTFVAEDYRLLEESGAVKLKVLRKGGLNGTVAVQYSAVARSAASGADYKLASGTLTFREGEMFKHIEVLIEDDSIPEFSETFLVQLSNPTGNARLGSYPSRTITIYDTDHLK